MAIATMEDLQGSIEVVVFPRLYEQTRPTPGATGAILLVAGRIDHKGEEVSLLADLVADWDDAVVRGPDAFARDVAAGDRSGGRGNGRRPPVAVGPGTGQRPGPANGAVPTQPVSVGVGVAWACRPGAPTATMTSRPRCRGSIHRSR